MPLLYQPELAPWRDSRVFSCILLAALVLLLTGCFDLGSANSDSLDDALSDTSPSSDSLSPVEGIPDNLASAVALVRPVGEPGEVLGSAVVISSDGLLLTGLDVVREDIEIVLPGGAVHQPALVSIEPAVDLALLKVPEQDLTPAQFSSRRPARGDEALVLGYDGSPGAPGYMSGNISAVVDAIDELDYRVRGPVFIDTDIPLLSGFVGGALVDDHGAFSGVLTPGEGPDGEQIFRSVSHWFVMAWLEARQHRLDTLAEASVDWPAISLPGGWAIRKPEGWNLNVTVDNDHSYRAELTPADPDVPLQLALSVEPNQYGSDAEAFVAEMFESRSSARVWSIARENGMPFVQIAMTQEGALVDLAYFLGDEKLIAVSLTSSYQPSDDRAQVDEARALFQTVVSSLHRPSLTD